MSQFSRWVASGCLVLVAALALAQEPPKPADAPMPADAEKPAKEQTIYIPYTKLRQIFEKEGRGVFVPYEEFQRLWKAAAAAAKKIEDIKPPVAALISEIDSEATVSRDVMTVNAKLQIEVLTEGWHYVHLRLSDAAIRSATIGDKPARIIFEAGKGHWVLLEAKRPAADGGQSPPYKPEKYELKLEYSKAFTKQPGTNSVEFDAPQAPVNRWQIKIPEPGVKVNVQPNISTTDAGAEKMGDADPAAAAPDAKKETLVQAFVGAAPQVRIDWTAKAEGAAGLAALVTVQARQDITIDEGVVRTRAHLTYDIQRADVTVLTVEVPADHNVVNVFDPNVQKWEKKTAGQTQTLTITLFQPTRGTQNVTIELEKFAGDKEMPQEMMHAEIKAPVVRAVQAGTADALSNIGRQQGVVVVRLGSALRGEATSRTGLLQIDAAELPAPLAGQEWNFAYRYAALPFDLNLSVEKLLPQIEVEELVEVYLEPNQTTANLLAVLNIQRAGIFQIELDVPEGFEVRTVQGRDVAGAVAVAVDSHHLEDVEYVPNPAQPDVKAKRKTKLLVNLSRRALGKVALWAELVKRQDDPNLLTPTNVLSVINVPLPRVQPSSVARTSGRVLVYAPESLRINPKESKGLRPISPAEAVQVVASTRGGRFPQLRELLAYAYTQEAASLIAEGQRRKPYIEARELLTAHVESGVVRYEATFFFDIKYSSVKTLRLDVPAAIAGDLRNQTPAIREQRIDPQPPDVAAGYVAWQLVGEGELLGSVTAKFTWEKKLGELPVGTAVAIDLPAFKAVGVDRFWGQIAASKAETIEITVKEGYKGLRPIDPQRDLLTSVPNAARAFEFHDDWSLAMQATRFQLEEVKRTSIERAVVRAVVTRGDQVAVQALYRLRSARQRIPVKLPGVDPANTSGVLDSTPLRINNAPAPLEHDGTYFYIPLTGHAADEPVLVELRYTVTGDQSSLELPDFSGDPLTEADDPAVQQVHLVAHLPEEQKLLGIRGPWTDESASLWRQIAPKDDQALLADVRQGVECGNAGDDFPVDGRRFVFSTLRPEPAAEGAVHMTTLHRNTVNFGVFLLVAIVGLVLTPQPAGTRLWYLAGLFVTVVLIAVFAPTLAQAILEPVDWGQPPSDGPQQGLSPLSWAVLLVLVVWGVRFLAWFIPGVIAWCTDSFKKAAAATAVAAAAAAATSAAATPPPAPEGAAGQSPFSPATPAPPAGEERREGGSNG
ncbi:MAG TPA: hypothetical protein VFB80_21885 [Pirellulaceae bacterium]|nr:hypothetical protein [Pirellulaceae bacterium]